MSSPISSISSPLSSFGIGVHDVPAKTAGHGGVPGMKFLCSYGGKILPRYPDGELRYVGGDTRLLTVDRSIRFSELLRKMEDEVCGTAKGTVALRCQIPTMDLDALVSITSDEDLKNLIEEYVLTRDHHRSPSTLRIRAFLYFNPPSEPTSPSLSQGKAHHHHTRPGVAVRSYGICCYHSHHHCTNVRGHGCYAKAGTQGAAKRLRVGPRSVEFRRVMANFIPSFCKHQKQHHHLHGGGHLVHHGHYWQ